MNDLTKNCIKEEVSKLCISEKKGLIIELINQLHDLPNSITSADENRSANKSYLELLRATYNYGQEEFDKNILYISSSALGLTIAFIEKVVKLENAINKSNLWIGWLLLGITILLFVLSHLISSLIVQRIISNTKESIKNNPDLLAQEVTKNKLDNIFGTVTINFINIVLYILMSSGIVYILIFLHNNLNK